MSKTTKRQKMDIMAGQDSPLGFAISSRDLEVLDMVRDAIAHNNVVLAFQPIMQARDPEKVALYEGLVRVLDPTGRIIPARDFMPAAENTELGRELDCIALAHGLRALHENPGLRLAINLSARSIGYRKWQRTLDRWLARDVTVGERLVLEITESSAMLVPEVVTDFMDNRQLQGICFALDDFGAGYTALRYLKDFFFDFLKIDGQFVRGIARDADNQAIVRAIVSIARHFEMVTVAEFVETPEDARVLIDLGVDCLQGHCFAAASIRPPWSEENGYRATA